MLERESKTETESQNSKRENNLPNCYLYEWTKTRWTLQEAPTDQAGQLLGRSSKHGGFGTAEIICTTNVCNL